MVIKKLQLAHNDNLPPKHMEYLHTLHVTVIPDLGSERMAPHAGQKSGSALNIAFSDISISFKSISERMEKVRHMPSNSKFYYQVWVGVCVCVDIHMCTHTHL